MQNVILKQSIITVNANCNTNAKCNKIGAKCNKVVNRKCNNFSVAYFLCFQMKSKCESVLLLGCVIDIIDYY